MLDVNIAIPNMFAMLHHHAICLVTTRSMLIAYFLYCASDKHSLFMMMLCTQTELPKDIWRMTFHD